MSSLPTLQALALGCLPSLHPCSPELWEERVHIPPGRFGLASACAFHRILASPTLSGPKQGQEVLRLQGEERLGGRTEGRGRERALQD